MQKLQFFEVNRMFINQEEGEHWRLNTVIPYREKYILQTGDWYAIKLNMQQHDTSETKLLFYARLQDIITKNMPVLSPVDIEEKGITPVLLTPLAGAWFLAIYSGAQSTPCPNHPITAGLKASAIIKYLLDSSPPIDGLIIDPYDKPVYILKETIMSWECTRDYQN